MFRDRPSTYEQVANALGALSERIGELEGEVAERLNPTPSAGERARRAIGRVVPGLTAEPAGLSRYIPNLSDYWPDHPKRDAQRQLRALRETGESLAHGAEDYLGSARQSLADWTSPALSTLRNRLPARHRPQPTRDNPDLTALLVIGGAVAAVGAAYYVTKKVQEHAEEPDYDVVRSDGAVEIRDYDAMIVAETVKSGYHEKARRIGFMTLADYIFAKNRPGKKIKMTTPVLQQLADGEGRSKGWAVRFVMPKKFTLASLPEPGTTDIALKDVAARRVAVIRFPGNFTATLASKHLMTLYNYLADNNLKQKGDPEYAFYNPPWTPGFMKRNEILIEIER
ncbi:heme-binding protein [Jiella sp. MQZ9-1]|uniref:Heme-binding protein n=1 Tax=Jiella flava TaxID=2816857 RepID=A0A939FW66_9HYPH|nr:heme-binding protein [Jiella flava]MBO0662637.1 heme-binding protein [Jiella flava]MCD2471059.1 heme-binding protein [Jiella flava]